MKMVPILLELLGVQAKNLSSVRDRKGMIGISGSDISSCGRAGFSLARKSDKNEVTSL